MGRNHFKSHLKELKKKRKSTKGRFNLHNYNSYGAKDTGVIPFPQEWDLEKPSQNKNENIFIYGTNSWGQYFILNLKWRPKSDGKVLASLQITFKDDDGMIYDLNEEEVIKNTFHSNTVEYKIGGIGIEVLQPLRQLRIKIRGFLRRRDTNELCFARIRLFWKTLSNPFDFLSNFNDEFIANEVRDTKTSNILFEDRYEQMGQIKGNIEFQNLPQKEIFLWGSRSKQIINDNSENTSVTRILGFSKIGIAFHVGCISYDNGISYRYGNFYWGLGVILPITSTSISCDDIKKIKELIYGEINKEVKFNIENKGENKSYEIEIKPGDGIVSEIKINGNEGKCIIIQENNDSKDSLKTETVASVGSVVQPEEILKYEIPSNLVQRISEEECKQVLLCGGKGSSLGFLLDLSKSTGMKFSVPKGIVVTINSYNFLLEQSPFIKDQIESLQKLAWSENRNGLEEASKKLVKNISIQSLPQKIKNEIIAQLTSIFGHDYDKKLFAIRSSAVGEDSENMSAAGQMSSFLGITGIHQICTSVMKCWASQFSYAAVEYKRGYGQLINSPMAVIIQEMVDCDSAGVIFTCDPLTGDERSIIINANHGIGESVVSGMAEPDNIKVKVDIKSNSLSEPRKIKGIDSIEIGSKEKHIKLNLEGFGGTFNVNLENDNKCCLKESQIIRLSEVAVTVHKHYGNPRDIEWGIKDDVIYLFQSRPITNLDNNWTEYEIMHEFDSPHVSEREYYNKTNAGEVMPGAGSALFLSWFSAFGIILYKLFGPLMNADTKTLPYCFSNGFGVLCNQLFYCINNGVSHMDPKCFKNKALQLGTWGQVFEDEQLYVYSKERSTKNRPTNIRAKLKSSKLMLSIMFSVKKRLRKLQNEYQSYDLLKGKEFDSAKQLCDCVINSYQDSYSVFETHSMCSLGTVISEMMMLSVLIKENEENPHLFSDMALLLSTCDNVISVEVPKYFREIALKIEDRHKFCSLSDDEALHYLQTEDLPACIKFREFISKYGHRGYKELDPYILQWEDDPLPAVRALKSILQTDPSSYTIKEQKTLDQIISSLKTPLTYSQKFFLKKLIVSRCRVYVGLREASKNLGVWVLNRQRKVYWKLAHLMLQEGRIPDSDLLFHLTISEIEKLVTQRDPNIVSRAKFRKRLHAKKDQLVFGDTIIGPDMKPQNDKEPSEGLTALTKLTGTTVCYGKVKARACVAVNLEEARNLKPGDVLITFGTDIGWSPYFPMLSGIVTEVGGIISHGAVIARELGLPSIIGVSNATKVFKTGDMILLDAQVGEVSKLDPDAENEEILEPKVDDVTKPESRIEIVIDPDPDVNQVAELDPNIIEVTKL